MKFPINTICQWVSLVEIHRYAFASKQEKNKFYVNLLHIFLFGYKNLYTTCSCADYIFRKFHAR